MSARLKLPRLRAKHGHIWAALALILPAIASAQPTITLTQLLAQGFTNGPLTGYSLKVSGIKNISSATFTDIRPEPMAGNAVQAHGGTVRVYGLNYAVASASVDGGELSFNGSISLPPPLDSYESAIADAHGLVVGSSGNIGFDSPGGTFTIPHTFELGPLTIDSVTLTINPAQQTFGGSALIGIGKGPTGAYCPAFSPGPPLFGASVLVVGGKLDQIGLMGENLRRPLGATGAFLDALSGQVGNLSANGGRNWYVTASATVDVGCPVADVYPMSIHANATVNYSGFVDINGGADIFGIPVGSAYLRYNPPYTIAAGANVNYLNTYYADCAFQVTSGPTFSGSANGRLQIPNYVPVAGGWTVASAHASFNNSGFRGSVSVNISPEIPSVCTPKICAPGICIHWWSPSWSHPGRTCKKCWDGPCIPPVCTPRIPAVSATVGFKFENGSFSFNQAAFADPMVEPWENSFQQSFVDPETHNKMCFMCNWSRVDKCSTGPCGRPIVASAPAADGGVAASPPPLSFNVPDGEDSVMFRLTWENPNNALVFMNVRFSDYPPLGVSTDEVSPTYHILQPLDPGMVNFGQGSYLIIDGSRREAIIGIPHPYGGTYDVTIDHTNNLGNYAVELLTQNIPPTVAIEEAGRTETAGLYNIYYASTIYQGNPSTRIMLSQVACDPGTTRQVKAGGVYLVDTIASITGEDVYRLDTRSLNVPDGDYNVVLNIDDPDSQEVEAISTEKVTVHNAAAPPPVPSFAVRGENHGFSVQWQPSPSSNVSSYVVAYTKSSLPNEFEGHASFGESENMGTITNLINGQPYLVTIFVMGTNGLQSCPAEKQRVIPTEGYGLNPPIITSSPRVAATVGQPYVYFPEVFDADDVLRPAVPLPDGEEISATDPAQDGQGRQWTLITAPTGMTIDPTGLISWTPTDQQVSNYTVTVRVTELSSLPPFQDAGALVNPRFGEQTYTVTVVGAGSPPQFEQNHYRFLSAPPATAYAGETYRYAPLLLFPTNSFTLTIDDGPADMMVVQEGTAPDITNVVIWSVPTDAVGHRVVLRAVPDIDGGATPDDVVLQEYFLDVTAPAKQIPQSTVINLATPTAQGFGLRWIGSATNYQVQRATSLIAPTNTVWQNISGTQPAAAVNFFVDTNANARAFYRILGTP